MATMGNKKMFEHIETTGIKEVTGLETMTIDGIKYNILPKYVRPDEKSLSPFEKEKGIIAFSGKKFTHGHGVRLQKLDSGKGFVALSATFSSNHNELKAINAMKTAKISEESGKLELEG